MKNTDSLSIAYQCYQCLLEALITETSLSLSNVSATILKAYGEQLVGIQMNTWLKNNVSTTNRNTHGVRHELIGIHTKYIYIMY